MSSVSVADQSTALPSFAIRSSGKPSARSAGRVKSRIAGVNTPLILIHHSGETHPASSSSRLARYEATFTKDDMDVDADIDEEDGGPVNAKIAVSGTSIASSHVFMKGHGTFLSATTDEIMSSMCGTVERVNKLISVRPTRSRYNAEVGDLVIGRVTEVGPKRWKVDINSKTDSSLQLSSINLPGGIQRRKVESDELQMRNFFQENDLLVAEVQMLYQDNSSALHTRSLRYGKLKNGALVRASPNLIQRLKSHFVHLHDEHINLDLIIGLNGYIWIAKHLPYSPPSNGAAAEEQQGLAGSGVGRDIDATYSDQNDADLSVNLRQQIKRVSKCIHVLNAFHHPISDVHILAVVTLSLQYIGPIGASPELSDWEHDHALTSLIIEQLRTQSDL